MDEPEPLHHGGTVSEDVIDWTTELKKISREFDGLPPEPSANQLRAIREAERRERERQEAAQARLGVALRLALVLGLAGAIVFWPYPAPCGLRLAGYLAAIGMVGVGGLWVAAYTWRHRMAKTHALALLIVLWGLALAASEVLPRVGYARTDAQHPAQWRCS
jgi:hypothetical protein